MEPLTFFDHLLTISQMDKKLKEKEAPTSIEEILD
jgi:hypothetical protein